MNMDEDLFKEAVEALRMLLDAHQYVRREALDFSPAERKAIAVLAKIDALPSDEEM